jgi:hypothetical protein
MNKVVSFDNAVRTNHSLRTTHRFFNCTIRSETDHEASCMFNLK